MTTGELLQSIQQLDKSKEIVVENSFQFDNDETHIIGVREKNGKNILKVDQYTILMDIGDFCLLKKQEEALQMMLDSLSEIILSSDKITKDEVMRRIRDAAKLKVDDIQKCIPPSL